MDDCHKEVSVNPRDNNFEGSLDIYGKLLIGMRYDEQKEIVTVHVISAQNLPRREDKSSPDTFVEVRLMGRKDSVRTTVVNSTVNPNFDQTLELRVSRSEKEGELCSI